MEDKLQQGSQTRNTSVKFKNFVRQNSKAFGDAVKSIVLPIIRRSVNRRRSQKEDVELDSESDDNLDPNKRHFPFFVTLVAFIQMGIFITLKMDTLLTLCYDPFRRHEIWRFLSVFLVHASYPYLFVTIILELILGLFLESVHGFLRIGGIFLASVLGGSFAITVLSPLEYAAGGEAAVYGLWAAHVCTLLLNWKQMDRRVLRIILLSIPIFVLTILAVFFYEYFPIPNQIFLPIGGVLGGFVASAFILKNFEVLEWERKFQRMVAILAIFILITVVIMNIFYTSHYRESEHNFDYFETFTKYFNEKKDAWYKLFLEICGAKMECRDGYHRLTNQTLLANSTITS